MLAEEIRPLKRPKLGIPDFYPQEDRQKEVRRPITVVSTSNQPPLHRTI